MQNQRRVDQTGGILGRVTIAPRFQRTSGRPRLWNGLPQRESLRTVLQRQDFGGIAQKWPC